MFESLTANPLPPARPKMMLPLCLGRSWRPPRRGSQRREGKLVDGGQVLGFVAENDSLSYHFSNGKMLGFASQTLNLS